MVREGLQSDEAPNPAEARPARERLDEEIREAGITAGDIVETIHDPLVVLTSDLRVQVVQHGSADSAITVSASGDDPGGDVVVSVHNLGAPIPAEARERIFEPFQRGASGAAAGEGDHERKGFGLYIARRMAEAHGGALEVESSGEGTIFSIRLPRNAANESDG